MKVEYHPAIEAEVRAIQDYYEERSPGLGGEFIDEFEQQVLQLAASPERWMVITGDETVSVYHTSPISGVWIRSGLESRW